MDGTMHALHARRRNGIIIGGANLMERNAGLRNLPGEPGILERAQPERRRSVAPHHRRRRAVALLSLGLIALLVFALLGRGGAAPSRTSVQPHGGFFAVIRELARGGPRSLFAREIRAENSAIDRTLAYTPYVRIAGSQHREVALTFDDGPGPYTPEILAILEREHVPATFFEIGILERYFYSSTSRMAADGDAIGDHTERHLPMSRLSAAAQRAELLEQARTVERHGASFPRLFRPPYGLWNSTTLSLLRRYHMLMVLWTVDTSDYLRPGVPAIVAAAIKGARPGAIILLHDAGGDRSQTVSALPRIIAALRRRHYLLVTVPQLLLDNPAPRVQNIAAVIGKGG
jgi:peptidoglycan-N-acetylglucosamine deacetylase